MPKNLQLNVIHNADCMEFMDIIPANSVDMVLCDLPYGMTQNKWDSVIPLDLLWVHYKRIIKHGSAVVLTASQPFTSTLVSSNLPWFRYEWIWRKNHTTGHLNTSFMPLKEHESILVFSDGRHPYYPQGLQPYNKLIKRRKVNPANYNISGKEHMQASTNYPRSVLEFDADDRGRHRKHPTQKPVALFEYLIRTYTGEGETVLDNCIGSGTTAIACMNTRRNYVGFESDEKYFQIAEKRINAHREALDA